MRIGESLNSEVGNRIDFANTILINKKRRKKIQLWPEEIQRDGLF